MGVVRNSIVAALGGITLCVSAVRAQRQQDLDVINRIIDQYGALDDSMDMRAQAKLMAPNRVWISQGGGRRTDEAANMRIQQAGYDALRKALPGYATITEDRDRVIRFHAGGAVAIASFYRYTRVYVPTDGSAEAIRRYGGPVAPQSVTLVLERIGSEWKIVHTHYSDLAVPS